MTSGGNIHASCILLGERGLLVTGPSGSGKTTLALALIERFRTAGRFARLVADDQVILAASAGRLIATAPTSIAGLVEAYGLGPRSAEAERRAVVDVVVELVPVAQAPRFQEAGTCVLAGCQLPLLMLPQGNAACASLAVSAWLPLPPFL